MVTQDSETKVEGQSNVDDYIPLDTDHSGLVKFSTRIREMVEGALGTVKARFTGVTRTWANPWVISRRFRTFCQSLNKFKTKSWTTSLVFHPMEFDTEKLVSPDLAQENGFQATKAFDYGEIRRKTPYIGSVDLPGKVNRYQQSSWPNTWKTGFDSKIQLWFTSSFTNRRSISTMRPTSFERSSPSS